MDERAKLTAQQEAETAADAWWQDWCEQKPGRPPSKSAFIAGWMAYRKKLIDEIKKLPIRQEDVEPDSR